MLTIRREQIRILAEAGLQRWLRAYLAGCYPSQAQRLGPAGMATLTKQLVDQAGRHGIRAAEDVRQYVHVGFLLGADFETRHSWAREILDDRDLDPGWRAQALLDAAKGVLRPPRPEAALGED